MMITEFGVGTGLKPGPSQAKEVWNGQGRPGREGFRNGMGLEWNGINWNGSNLNVFFSLLPPLEQKLPLCCCSSER